MTGGLWCVLAVLAAMPAGCAKKSPKELLDQAKVMMQNRDIYGAEMQFQKIAEQYPESKEAVFARMGLVECYRLTKDYGSAFEQLDALMTILGGPQTADGYQALMMKIQLFGDERKYGEAIKLVEETSPTLKGAPLGRRMHLAMVLGRLYLHDNQRPRAQALALRLLDTVADKPEAHGNALKLIAMTHDQPEDQDKLIGIYQDYLKRFPQSDFRPDVLIATGHLYRTKGQTDEANRLYDQAETLLKTQLEKALGAEAKSTLLMKLAGMYQFRAEPDKARKVLERIANDYKGGPLAGQALLALASMDHAAGLLDAAAEKFKHVLAEYPESGLAQQAMQGLQMLQQPRPTSETQTRVAPTSPTLGTTRATTVKPIVPTVQATPIAPATPTTHKATP
jgi:TolA-binding protein